MFKWSLEIRALAYLRRAVRALEKLADAQGEIARLRAESWNLRNSQRVVRKESFVMGSLDIDEANKLYHQQLIDRGEEDEQL